LKATCIWQIAINEVGAPPSLFVVVVDVCFVLFGFNYLLFCMGFWCVSQQGEFKTTQKAYVKHFFLGVCTGRNLASERQKAHARKLVPARSPPAPPAGQNKQTHSTFFIRPFLLAPATSQVLQLKGGFRGQLKGGFRHQVECGFLAQKHRQVGGYKTMAVRFPGLPHCKKMRPGRENKLKGTYCQSSR
jgi:hypothetical protein